jgi:hypothetical protein
MFVRERSSFSEKNGNKQALGRSLFMLERELGGFYCSTVFGGEKSFFVWEFEHSSPSVFNYNQQNHFRA